MCACACAGLPCGSRAFAAAVAFAAAGVCVSCGVCGSCGVCKLFYKKSSLFLIFIVKTEKRQYYSGQIYNFIVVPDGDGFAECFSAYGERGDYAGDDNGDDKGGRSAFSVRKMRNNGRSRTAAYNAAYIPDNIVAEVRRLVF